MMSELKLDPDAQQAAYIAFLDTKAKTEFYCAQVDAALTAYLAALPKQEPSGEPDIWEQFKADVRMRLNRGDGPRSFVIERVFDVMNSRTTQPLPPPPKGADHDQS
jgi:hypothetical protein